MMCTLVISLRSFNACIRRLYSSTLSWWAVTAVAHHAGMKFGSVFRVLTLAVETVQLTRPF